MTRPALLRLLLLTTLAMGLLAMPGAAHAKRVATVNEHRAIVRTLMPSLPARVRPCVARWRVFVNTVAPRGRFGYAAPVMKSGATCALQMAGMFVHRPGATNVWRNLRFTSSGGHGCSELPRPLTAAVYRDLVGRACIARQERVTAL